MFTINRTICLAIYSLVMGVILSACAPAPEINGGQILVNPDTNILINGQATLKIDVMVQGASPEFKWTAEKGKISNANAPSVIYTAPAISGPDIVTVVVTAGKTTFTQTTTFNVIEPTPTSMPTVVVTDTPVPTNTPLPPPLLEIFPQVGDGQKFVFKNDVGILDDKYDTDEICVYSGVYGLWLSYDMKGLGNGGWGVGWNNTPFNAIDFTSLTFQVRGISGGENGFQIGIKDADGMEKKVETKDVTVLDTNWAFMEIPLSKFSPVNLAAIQNINFGFNKDHGSGVACIDEIVFK